jgi:hypothetical protein
LDTQLQVRKFHSQFYRLNNFNLIVAGIIDHSRLLTIVQASETALMADGDYRELRVCFGHPNAGVRHELPFDRPFVTDVPALTTTRVETIVCPCDDESKAMAVFAWRGPAAEVSGRRSRWHCMSLFAGDEDSNRVVAVAYLSC